MLRCDVHPFLSTSSLSLVAVAFINPCSPSLPLSLPLLQARLKQLSADQNRSMIGSGSHMQPAEAPLTWRTSEQVRKQAPARAGCLAWLMSGCWAVFHCQVHGGRVYCLCLCQAAMRMGSKQRALQKSTRQLKRALVLNNRRPCVRDKRSTDGRTIG